MVIAQPPIFVIDDDDWLSVHDTWQRFVASIEWSYVEELRSVVDSAGRRLAVSSTGEEAGDISVGPPHDLEGMYSSIERYFHTWTDTPPPKREADLVTYFARLREMVETTPTRGRRRRT